MGAGPEPWPRRPVRTQPEVGNCCSGGSYSASVFYLALSIIHVFISSLFHIKSELLISLENQTVLPL